MADLASQSPAREANALTFSAASSGGDAFVNTGRNYLLVRHTNSGGSSVTLTIETQATVDGEAVADKTVVIAAGDDPHLLGPFPMQVYNDGDQKVQLTWSSETDIELAVIEA